MAEKAVTDPQPSLRSAEEYRLSVEPSPLRVRVLCNGQRIADTHKALIMFETRLEPVYYFPAEDVRTDLLEPSSLTTHCPFKGQARYWSLSVSGKTEKKPGVVLPGAVPRSL